MKVSKTDVERTTWGSRAKVWISLNGKNHGRSAADLKKRKHAFANKFPLRVKLLIKKSIQNFFLESYTNEITIFMLYISIYLGWIQA